MLETDFMTKSDKEFFEEKIDCLREMIWDKNKAARLEVDNFKEKVTNWIQEEINSKLRAQMFHYESMAV